MALLAHMLLDKFWNYPASLTIMLIGFGVLVRPRIAFQMPQAPSRLLRPTFSLGWVSAALAGCGLILLWFDLASPLPDHVGSLVPRVLGAALLFAGLLGGAMSVIAEPAERSRVASMALLGAVVVAMGWLAWVTIDLHQWSTFRSGELRRTGMNRAADFAQAGGALAILGLMALIGLAGWALTRERERAHLLELGGDVRLGLFLTGLAVSMVLCIPGIRLAATSHYLASGRLHHQRAEIYKNLLDNNLRARQLTGRSQLTPEQEQSHRRNLSEQTALGETHLLNARRLLPWEIDTWTRSLDLESQINGRSMLSPLPLYLLRRSIEVAPNYYPVKRNLASALWQSGQTARSRGQTDEMERRRTLAADFYEQVRALRPDEIMTMYQLGEIYADAGSTEEALDTWTDYVDFEWVRDGRVRGGIDRFGLGFQDLARLRVAQLLSSSGEYEQALQRLRDAGARGQNVNIFNVWFQEVAMLVRLGRPEDALEALRARANQTTDDLVQAHRSQYLRGPNGSIRAPQNQSELAIELFAAIHSANVDSVASQTRFSNSVSPEARDWTIAILAASLVDEDLAREHLERGLAMHPDSEILRSAEAAAGL
jgi:tetratricopeptide (TPR) repeat protein